MKPPSLALQKICQKRDFWIDSFAMNSFKIKRHIYNSKKLYERSDGLCVCRKWKNFYVYQKNLQNLKLKRCVFRFVKMKIPSQHAYFHIKRFRVFSESMVITRLRNSRQYEINTTNPYKCLFSETWICIRTIPCYLYSHKGNDNRFSITAWVHPFLPRASTTQARGWHLEKRKLPRLKCREVLLVAKHNESYRSSHWLYGKHIWRSGIWNRYKR